MFTAASGRDALTGKVTAVVLLSSRIWKLKSKAIGSHDAEVQSILEAEDLPEAVPNWTARGGSRCGPS